jgi:hypothetical protein
MKCPACGVDDDMTIDSRATEGGAVTRRRRACHACQSRWTTYEQMGRPNAMSSEDRTAWRAYACAKTTTDRGSAYDAAEYADLMLRMERERFTTEQEPENIVMPVGTKMEGT